MKNLHEQGGMVKGAKMSRLHEASLAFQKEVIHNQPRLILSNGTIGAPGVHMAPKDRK